MPPGVSLIFFPAIFLRNMGDIANKELGNRVHQGPNKTALIFGDYLKGIRMSKLLYFFCTCVACHCSEGLYSDSDKQR